MTCAMFNELSIKRRHVSKLVVHSSYIHMSISPHDLFSLCSRKHALISTNDIETERSVYFMLNIMSTM